MNGLVAVRQTVDLSGIKLSYWEWNRGGEPLLLLHGLADCGMVWASLGDYLAPNYHIVAPDLRGHGDSSKPQKGYRFVDFIEDLEALIKHLGWSSASVLAHSWSAKLLTIWATEHPERFRNLILVDPFFIDKIPSWLGISLPILYRVLPLAHRLRRGLLGVKTEQEGKVYLEVDRFFPSSKTCNVCLNQVSNLTLDVRTWTCTSCDTKHDRDVNAARNIRDEGLRILASGTGATAYRPDVRPKSSGRKKATVGQSVG